MKNWIIKHKNVIYIMLLALILRLVFLLLAKPWSGDGFERLIIEDGREYYDLALSLLNSHSFNGNLFRTPGQPMIIASVFLLFGKIFYLVLILQILLNVISVLLIYILVKEMLLPYFDDNKSEVLAIVTCFLYAVDLQLIYFSSSSYYADINFSFFVCCALLLFLMGVKQVKFSYFIWAGFFAGIATLLKPAGQYLPVVFPVLYLYTPVEKPSLLSRLKSFIAFFVVFVAVLTPWIYRNYIQFDALVFSSSGNENIYGNAYQLDYYYKNNQQVDNLTPLLEKEGYNSERNYYQKTLIQKKVGMRYLKANLKDFSKFYMTNVARIYLNLSSTHICNALKLPNIIKTTYGITQFNNVSYAITWFFKNKTIWEITVGAYTFVFLFLVYIAAFVGLADLMINRNWRLAAVALVFIAYFSLLPCQAGQSRYKFPSMQFYLMFSSIGFYRILKSTHSKSATDSVK